MPPEKLLAEWFWCDRWTGSRGFLLPLEPRGLYREMLTQAWHRKARLPNDPVTIQRAVGCTSDEWNRNWPVVSEFWVVSRGYLVNRTQQKVYREAMAAQRRASERGRKGGLARAQAHAQAQLKLKQQTKPPSPSPSPIVSVKNTETKNPPTPLAGGRRPTRNELRHARRVLANRFGRCNHEPACANAEACAAALVLEIRSRAAAS